jgi:putative addiction module component (TIGR02574 family)
VDNAGGKAYILIMASPFENVAEQALSLSVRDRLRLANELLVSVEPPGSAEIERAWEEEIQRRIGEIDSGNAKGRGWDEIKRDFQSRYGK